MVFEDLALTYFSELEKLHCLYFMEKLCNLSGVFIEQT